MQVNSVRERLNCLVGSIDQQPKPCMGTDNSLVLPHGTMIRSADFQHDHRQCGQDSCVFCVDHSTSMGSDPVPPDACRNAAHDEFDLGC